MNLTDSFNSKVKQNLGKSIISLSKNEITRLKETHSNKYANHLCLKIPCNLVHCSCCRSRYFLNLRLPTGLIGKEINELIELQKTIRYSFTALTTQTDSNQFVGNEISSKPNDTEESNESMSKQLTSSSSSDLTNTKADKKKLFAPYFNKHTLSVYFKHLNDFWYEYSELNILNNLAFVKLTAFPFYGYEDETKSEKWFIDPLVGFESKLFLETTRIKENKPGQEKEVPQEIKPLDFLLVRLDHLRQQLSGFHRYYTTKNEPKQDTVVGVRHNLKAFDILINKIVSCLDPSKTRNIQRGKGRQKIDVNVKPIDLYPNLEYNKSFWFTSFFTEKIRITKNKNSNVIRKNPEPQIPFIANLNYELVINYIKELKKPNASSLNLDVIVPFFCGFSYASSTTKINAFCQKLTALFPGKGELEIIKFKDYADDHPIIQHLFNYLTGTSDKELDILGVRNRLEALDKALGFKSTSFVPLNDQNTWTSEDHYEIAKKVWKDKIIIRFLFFESLCVTLLDLVEQEVDAFYNSQTPLKLQYKITKNTFFEEINCFDLKKVFSVKNLIFELDRKKKIRVGTTNEKDKPVLYSTVLEALDISIRTFYLQLLHCIPSQSLSVQDIKSLSSPTKLSPQSTNPSSLSAPNKVLQKTKKYVGFPTNQSRMLNPEGAKKKRNIDAIKGRR